MRAPDRLLGIAVAFLGIAEAAPAAGQSPAQRTVIEAFRDSLARASDSAGLARLEATLVTQARRNRNDAMAHLRLGFLALRQAELGRIRYYEDAAAEFQWVTRIAPAWPYGWYGLGLAEFGLARSGAQMSGPARGPVTYARAAVALARAARADPSATALLVREANLARQQRQPARAEVMLDAVRRVNQPRRSTNPQLLSALGILEREFGDPNAALEAFEAWVPVAGRLRGLALLEVARTRFLLGRLDGVEPYYTGAVFDDSATVANYRADLVPIAGDAELQAFDAARGEARAETLRRFWGRRDAADLRAAGERLREHYRRLFYVRRAFPRFAPDRLASLAPGVATVLEDVDDRGLIYLRHGEPDARVTLNTLGIEPNESWRYTRAEGDLVLHFVARHEPDVYRLVESLMDVVDYAPAPTAQRRALEVERQDAVLLSREQLSPVYRRGRHAAPDSVRVFLLAERAMGRASLVNATTTDTYRRRFARALGAVSDLALFSDGQGGVRLHLAYAVPFQAVGVAWLGQGIAYPLRLRLAIWTPEGTTLAQVDSIVRPVTWASPEAAWLAGVVSLDVPTTGRFRVSALLQDGEDTGTVLPTRSLEAGLHGDSLWMSDLALGARAAPWAVSIGEEERAYLAPAGAFARGQELELAYQAVGPAGLPITAQVTLMRIDEPAGVLWSRRRTTALEGGRAVLREPVDLRRLAPGRYRIEVSVTSAGGLSRRWREFEVGR